MLIINELRNGTQLIFLLAQGNKIKTCNKKQKQNVVTIKKIKIMKLQTNTLLASISPANVNSLTTIVKETIDANCSSKKQARKLSIAELWMINKQRRTYSSRRFIYS